jgi:CRP-like cAMP-binding protein
MSKNPFQNFMVGFNAGERVYSEGDAGAVMYIVHSGRVRLFRMIDGEQHDLGTMEKGDFFGEMSILEGLPRTTCAEAEESTQLIEINNMTFDKMIKSNIEIAIRMLRKLSIRLREAERRLGEQPATGARPGPQPQAAQAESDESDMDEASCGTRLVAEENGSIFPLDGSEVLIGRYDPVTELKPDVDLSDLDLKRSVSRRHARILQGDEGYAVVEEVGALNGTFVNGKQIVTGRAHPVSDGDKLSFGMVNLVFHT